MTCPAWCTMCGEHTAHISDVHLHGRRNEISVAMATDETRREPLIYINDVETPWHCSAKLATLLELLGQPEAAATVTRLAELGEPAIREPADPADYAGRYVPLHGAVD